MFDVIAPIAGMVFAVVGIILAIKLVVTIINLRRVVEPNEVHVVQSAKNRKSYGSQNNKLAKETNEELKNNGNVYYEWPKWVPIIGITKTILPISMFKISLTGYEAYDVDKVPFNTDVVAFFRISDTNLAAQRAKNFQELEDQIKEITRGAVRAVLARDKVEAIMLERPKYGEEFTEQIRDNLKQWGVTTETNVELMDIRDTEGSQVIEEIMAKKSSFIQMESRTEVAENNKKAVIAEINAQKEADLIAENARQVVGQKEQVANQEIGIATEQARQEIKAQEKITMEKQMAVIKVEEVKRAEITKEMEVVKASEDQETTVIRANGDFQAEQYKAQGIEVVGKANAEAEKAMQLAPVEAQIVLAQEIGENPSYMEFLLTSEKIDMEEVVGVEKAKALKEADINVIANSGNDSSGGINSFMDLFSPKGGTSIAGMLTALQQTDEGKALMTKVTDSVKKAPQFTQTVENAPETPKVFKTKEKPSSE